MAREELSARLDVQGTSVKQRKMTQYVVRKKPAGTVCKRPAANLGVEVKKSATVKNSTCKLRRTPFQLKSCSLK